MTIARINCIEQCLQNKKEEAITLLWENQTLTYGALKQLMAKHIQAYQQLGIQQGSRVGLLAYNDPFWVSHYLALLAFGATVIPLSFRLTAPEIDTILQDASADYLFIGEGFQDSCTTPKIQILTQQHIQEHLVSSEQPATLAYHHPVETQPAVLIYTSGTTGTPKGVMLSHRNLLADTQANATIIEAVATDRFITISPLFHVFGQVNILLTALWCGAAVVLIRKFNPKTVLEAIETHHVTFMAAVPTMYQMMLSILQERQIDLSSLRVCHSGAAPMPEETFHQIEARFGAPVQEGYGLSEASSIVCSNPLHGKRKPRSVGLPLSGVRVAVLDETMAPVPTGEIGELHVQGETVMLGYLNRPEETAKALVNGWLKTKDMAYQDEEGYIYIVDRKDDLINIGGVKVYPREIEEVLYRHPAVKSVAVVGVASALYHEEIKAYVVLNALVLNATASDTNIFKSIQEFCRAHLADYKIPSIFEQVDEIPQGATGKILRKNLKGEHFKR